MLYNIVLASATYQHESATGVYEHLLAPESPSHPILSLQVVTDNWTELPVSHSKCPLALYLVLYLFFSF